MRGTCISHEEKVIENSATFLVKADRMGMNVLVQEIAMV
jgi:hypothetical protein